MVDIECPIKLCIEDPVATTATLQNLLSTIDVTIDDVVAGHDLRKVWRLNPRSLNSFGRVAVTMHAHGKSPGGDQIMSSGRRA
jgi:hypothetical protein